MKTNKTLRLTHSQYREFARIAKSHGVSLSISSHKEMGCWGLFSLWAAPAINDCREEIFRCREHCQITISTTINTKALRECCEKRPELDWSALEDDEIYPFVLWHEIGHRTDNFCIIDVITGRLPNGAAESCRATIGMVNEALADRFAWNKIRPNTPIPLNRMGCEKKDYLEQSIRFLEKHCRRGLRQIEQLNPDQYCDVPYDMLISASRASFVGSMVNTKLMASIAEKH